MKNLSTSCALVALVLSIFFLADFWFLLMLPSITYYYLLIIGMAIFVALAFFLNRESSKSKLLFLDLFLIVLSILSMLSLLVLA